MPTIELENTVLEVDGDGFMSKPEEWNKDIATLIAKYDGIEEMC